MLETEKTKDVIELHNNKINFNDFTELIEKSLIHVYNHERRVHINSMTIEGWDEHFQNELKHNKKKIYQIELFFCYLVKFHEDKVEKIRTNKGTEYAIKKWKLASEKSDFKKFHEDFNFEENLFEALELKQLRSSKKIPTVTLGLYI